MDSATHDLLYQQISELVYDEERIVTIASVMSKLKISKDDALVLLKEFTSAHGKAKSGAAALLITYLLYGTLKDGKCVTLSLVKEHDLQDKRCLFENISSETIYSVQVGETLDFNLLTLANVGCENSGTLVSKNCIKRNLKPKRIPVVQSVSNNLKQNVTSNGGSSLTSSQSIKTHSGEDGKQSQASQKQNKSKQGGLINFFAKASTKAENVRVDPPVKNEKISSNTSPNDKSVEEEKAKDVKSQIDKSFDKDLKTSDDSKRNKSSDRSDKEQTNNKKRKKGSKNNAPNKKRKRIQETRDSDSSDMFDDDDTEDLIEMSDEEPPPAPVVKPVPVPKNKKRKAVDKTHMDEEGFIVTTTEYIYETASEDEEPPKVPKPENKILLEKKNETSNLTQVKKGKTAKKVNGKQPTLMSFFKKS